jgi:hypothetical protein
MKELLNQISPGEMTRAEEVKVANFEILAGKSDQDATSMIGGSSMQLP